jgi:hypothetical protein
MTIITNPTPDASQALGIYNWSVRSVVLRYGFKHTYLIGYSPTLDTLGIARIHRIYVKQRLIVEKYSDKIYLLCGKPETDSELEKFWVHYKKNHGRIINETDISHKY